MGGSYPGDRMHCPHNLVSLWLPGHVVLELFPGDEWVQSKQHNLDTRAHSLLRGWSTGSRHAYTSLFGVETLHIHLKDVRAEGDRLLHDLPLGGQTRSHFRHPRPCCKG